MINITRRQALVTGGSALLLPSFARSGTLGMDFIADGPFGIALLKPYALFGLAGLDPVTHSAFWSMLINTGALLAVSLAARQSPMERARAAMFVDAVDSGEAAQIWRRTAQVPDLMSLAVRFVGREKAAAAFEKNKEKYRIGERRKIRYLVVDTQALAITVSRSDARAARSFCAYASPCTFID